NLSGQTAGIGANRPENIPGLSDRFSGDGLRGGGNATLPGLGPSRPGAGGSGTRNPGLANDGVRPGAGGAGTRLPGLADGVRPGAGGAGTRFPNAGDGVRPGAGGAGERWSPGQSGQIPERHQDLANRFDDHWGDSGWHHQNWEGPNGGDINHIGFWGPNGYWGHTGVWGPNGGHWGHSTGIGPNGAWGRTVGWGPNGNVWGHGGAIGPNGAFGWAGYSGPAGHWSRNWGGWYNGYAPAWGYGRWDYLWNTYPVAMAFGATMWGINAANYAFGVGDYYNPYYDGGGYVSYAQPIVGDPSYMQPPADQAASDDQAPDPLAQQFNDAREAFKNEQFGSALEQTDLALKQAPRDAAVNEFRGLCLFALGRYRESAAVIHSVLAAGPGMDWTTMISLYSNPQTYTDQVRKLEDAIRQNPNQADLRFLLAYHYITQDHKDDAVALLKEVVRLQPKDQLAADLVKMYDPPVASASPPPANASADNVKEPAWPMAKLEGNWTAKRKDGDFNMTLNADDTFKWTFKRDGKDQTMSGAYVVRGKNLVLQPDSGGVMLSDIELKDDRTLEFSPIDDSNKLAFKKS
ncbi:hypothetical protein AYO47_03950, partial [Planctomyces sp. SCGC AG-212-M04]